MLIPRYPRILKNAHTPHPILRERHIHNHHALTHTSYPLYCYCLHCLCARSTAPRPPPPLGRGWHLPGWRTRGRICRGAPACYNQHRDSSSRPDGDEKVPCEQSNSMHLERKHHQGNDRLRIRERRSHRPRQRGPLPCLSLL